MGTGAGDSAGLARPEGAYHRLRIGVDDPEQGRRWPGGTPAPLPVLLHRVEGEAEAPSELSLSEPQPRPEGTNLVRRWRRIYRLRTSQLLVGPRIPILGRLRLEMASGSQSAIP